MRRRILAVAAVAAITAAAAFILAKSPLIHPRDPDAEPSHTPYVQLAAGTDSGVSWRLFAWEQQHQLCMTVLPAGFDPGHLPTDPSAPWTGGGGCGFDASHPGSGFYASAPGPAGGGLSFGPLPAAATGIRVAAHEILPTAPLPGGGEGLPAGRYWIEFTSAQGPSAADGGLLPTPQPLDAQGRPVAFQSF